MDLKQMLILAQKGNPEAFESILRMFDRRMRSLSCVQGRFDEDLYQELCITLYRCVNTFRI